MTGRLLKWGNSYGLRLAKADVEAAGLHEGDIVYVDLATKPGLVDLSGLWTFKGPDRHGARDHDKILDRGREERLAGRRRSPRG